MEGPALAPRWRFVSPRRLEAHQKPDYACRRAYDLAQARKNEVESEAVSVVGFDDINSKKRREQDALEIQTNHPCCLRRFHAIAMWLAWNDFFLCSLQL
jgi:hypothetical protein